MLVHTQEQLLNLNNFIHQLSNHYGSTTLLGTEKAVMNKTDTSSCLYDTHIKLKFQSDTFMLAIYTASLWALRPPISSRHSNWVLKILLGLITCSLKDHTCGYSLCIFKSVRKWFLQHGIALPKLGLRCRLAPEKLGSSLSQSPVYIWEELITGY